MRGKFVILSPSSLPPQSTPPSPPRTQNRDKFVVIVDELKLVDYIRGSAKKIQSLFEDSGCVANHRVSPENDKQYVTDNGNFIVDLYFKKDIGDLRAAGDTILRLAGVVEHGILICLQSPELRAAIYIIFLMIGQSQQKRSNT
ncbi:hypothetical protein R6Q59_012014 [Mikania micrantha]